MDKGAFIYYIINLEGKGGPMLMFVDMGEGSIDEKITDYVNMGSSLKKCDLFCVKNEICFMFSDKTFIFLTYLHMSTILHD